MRNYGLNYGWRGIAAVIWFGLTLFWVNSEAGWVTLWPSLLAIGVLLLTRRVVLGLVAGALGGSLILAAGAPLEALRILLVDRLVGAFSSSWNIGALTFTLLLGGMVALIERGGGLQTLAERWLKGRRQDAARRMQFGVVGLGLVCFFDGLANCMLVGRVSKSLADQSGVSRVKLAYLVDSTGSAIACVAFISTWIAFQLNQIRLGLSDWDPAVNPFSLFFSSLPYNAYCWATLAVVLAVVFRGWNPGPMKRFEAEARARVIDQENDTAEPVMRSTAVWRALLPVLVLAGVLIGGLYWDGREPGASFSWPALAEAFGRANASKILVWASVLASLTALITYPEKVARRGPGWRPISVYLGGVRLLLGPACILIGAWLLSGTLRELGTGAYVAGWLESGVHPALLPAMVFLVGAILSFMTGTSWGTMALLSPLALPAAALLAGTPDSAMAGWLIPAVIGAIFSGAVFGDHCSPMSDTTIVSAIACDVEPLDHVKTQLPYALWSGLVALVVGFIPAGLGVNSLYLWGLVIIAAVALPYWATRNSRQT